MNSSTNPPHLRRKLTKPPDHDMPSNDKDRRGTAALKRPDPPRHSSSFSKRHASFDSPREVPLPPTSPSAATQGQTSMRGPPQDYQFPAVFNDDTDWELISAGSSKLHKEKGKAGKASTMTSVATHVVPASPPSSFSKAGKLKSSVQGQQKDGGATIFPYSRPYSLPEAQSYQGRSPKDEPRGPSTVDRTSSASLPLPMQIPFSVLPKAGRPSMPSPVYERTAAEAQLRPPMAQHLSSSSSNSSNNSSDSLLSAPPSRRSSPPPPPPPAPRESPLKSGAAPMPPPELSTSNSGSVASYRPPRTTYSPVPPTPPDSADLSGATAMSRAPSLRKFPPPEPPVILPSVPDGVDVDVHARVPTPQARASTSSAATMRSPGASYEPFLSHAPPPVDSWIEVETTQVEYRLIVRLPGFKRDGITLATKKRRILHVVADSWEEGGGHFERRISFGYDADLAQVRAEFDGELLRIIIPRRMPPSMAVQGQSWLNAPAPAPAPSGR